MRSGWPCSGSTPDTRLPKGADKQRAPTWRPGLAAFYYLRFYRWGLGAEADLTRRRGTELHVGELVGGDDHLAALGVDEDQGALVAGECLRHRCLDDVAGLRRVDHQLAVCMLNADLDLHWRTSSLRCAWNPPGTVGWVARDPCEATLAPTGNYCCSSVRGNPRMPLHARLEITSAASFWVMPRGSSSQKRALTWAIPTRDTARRWACSSGRPVSSWITLVICCLLYTSDAADDLLC